MRKKHMRLLGTALALSLAVTEGILIAEARWQEALPLHLCSVAAMAALALAFGKKRWALDFLWYLGMPGALLALVFPAPAVSRYQLLLNASYVTTHALILIIPGYALRTGMRVRRGRGALMLAVLHGLAAIACGVNFTLGTDFMFLMQPPWGTPLCVPYAWGYGWYLLALEALACALVFMTGGILPGLMPKLFSPSQRFVLYKFA